MHFFTQASATHKRVWVDLLIDAVVATYYFWQVSVFAFGAATPAIGMLASIVLNSVLIALLMAVPLHTYIALRHKQEPPDEREILFKSRANQFAFNALLVLNAALLWLIASSALFPFPLSGVSLSPLAIAHLILLSIIIVRLIKAIVILQSYRRGY